MLSPHTEPLASDPLTPTALRDALDRAVANLRERQEPDGHWAGDYGGPMFLLPGLLITTQITGADLGDERKRRMADYLAHTQHADGGWGLHIEDDSTVLGTALNYAGLRILGVPADDPVAARARARLAELGGAEAIPTWGKFWLATLGVYDWDGVPPLLPELYLLPRAFPLHPSRLWCHTRQVFLPMSYCYGRRLTGRIGPLVRALREEMLSADYDAIDWRSMRSHVAAGDVHSPRTALLETMNQLQAVYDDHAIGGLRARALAHVLSHIQHEDVTTSYLTIGPVSKAMHMLVAWFVEPEGEAFARHLERMEDYLWEAPEGVKMQGYNGSQLWDASFAALAMLESGRAASEGAHRDVLERVHGYIDAQQVQADIPDGARFYRDPIVGSWPFSTAEQTWTVSDCTAEALKAALALEPLVERPIPRERLRRAADFLLAGQNPDGGWSEYERTRAPDWAERFNAAEVFGPIMRAYSYVECTSASLQALSKISDLDGYRPADIEAAIADGLDFVRETQRADGSWIGGWGLCFSYATWFGIDALKTGGVDADRGRVARAAHYLIARQRPDGGFAENWRSSVEERWVEHPEPLPVQSAWALLALTSAETVLDDPRVRLAADRAAAYLLGAQTAGGTWEQTAISGVFNRTCMIHYDNYRHVMPLWALARYARVRGAG